MATLKSFRLCALVLAGGTLAFAAPGEAAVFTNGSFESGSTGWTMTGNGSFANDSNRSHDGSRFASFNAGNATPNAVLSQSFDTVAGQTYDLSFYLLKYATGGGTAQLAVDVFDGGDFTGTNLLSNTAGSSTGYGTAPLSSYYTLFTSSFVAQGVTTTLRFTDTSTSGGLAFDVFLDAVSVTAVPTPAALPGGLALLTGVLLRRRR